MKIHVISTGKTTINADPEFEEAPVRLALQDVASAAAGELDPNHVGWVITDCTNSERSDISHDEYATVTEDDGTVLWAGWLDGRDEPAPLDPITVGQLVRNLEALAGEEIIRAEIAPTGYSLHARKATTLRECARQLRDALGQPS